MITNRFDLGFTAVTVTVNGTPVDFQVELCERNTFWLEDNKAYRPIGCYNIIINILSCQIGDVIAVQYDKGALENDGGGERMDNVVGYISGYAVAMGCPATDEYEDTPVERLSRSWPSDMNPTKRTLPYESLGDNGRGFEFRIVDDPVEYHDRFYRYNIEAIIAWEDSSKEYAWDLVSSLTG